MADTEESLAHADESAIGARKHRPRDRGRRAAATREAIEHLERAVGLDFRRHLPTDVYLALAHSYAAAGTPSRAVELLERALQSSRRHPGIATRIRFSTFLSYALTDLGELTRARAVVTEALYDSNQVTDPYTRVRLYWSLARISGEQSNSRAALDSFRRAIALLEATDDTLHLARAHMACAEMAMVPGEDSEAAEPHLLSAEHLLGPSASANDLAMLRRLQAMAATRAHEYERAEQFGRQALEYAVELPTEAGLALWAIAEARAGAGSPRLQTTPSAEAIDLLHRARLGSRLRQRVARVRPLPSNVDREHDAPTFSSVQPTSLRTFSERSTAERDLSRASVPRVAR